MKNILFAMTLLCMLRGEAVFAQPNSLMPLLDYWFADKPTKSMMLPKEQRAIEFKAGVREMLSHIELRANELNLKLVIPELPDMRTNINVVKKRQRYIYGSLDGYEMKCYETEIVAVLKFLESQVVARIDELHQAWRQAHPLEARIEDVERAAAAAEKRAANAEQKARNAESMANQNANEIRMGQMGLSPIGNLYK